ncbi:MAG: DinB family protein [Anaerolineales bacterium]|nr:DinB family protein [Anaerolineales bacterium]
MASELETYAEYFAKLNQAARDLLAGLPPAALNWRPLPAPPGEHPETNTLAGLGTHIAGSQRYFIGEVLHGRNPARNRDAELATGSLAPEAVAADVAEAAARVQATVAGLTPEALSELVPFRTGPVTKRWMILQMLTHVAGHLAEMSLIKQLWEAQPAEA